MATLPSLTSRLLNLIIAATLLPSAGHAQSCTADLNGDGEVDGADMAALLAQWGPCPKPETTAFFGSVVMPDGSPAAGVTLVGDLGGTASSNSKGQFQFEVQLSHGIDTLNITATIEVGSLHFGGTSTVSPVLISQPNDAGEIVLVATCDSTLGWSDQTLLGGLNGTVRTFEVFDDGTGSALYVGGDFTLAGGIAAIRVAKWNGSEWSAVGTGLPQAVLNFEVFDYGTGPRLYAISGTTLYRWSDGQWTLVPGVPSTIGSALASYDYGEGARLYFMKQWNMVEWDGATAKTLPDLPSADCLASATDPFGNALFIGSGSGLFRLDGYGVTTVHCGWSAYVSTIEPWQPIGDSPFAMYAGGLGIPATCGGVMTPVAKWSGFGWSMLGSGVGGEVSALGTFSGGATRSLIVGGDFTSVDGTPGINRIARWQNDEWHSMGAGLNARARAIIEFDDGTGPAIYVGGDFTVVNGQPRGHIAKWGCLRE